MSIDDFSQELADPGTSHPPPIGAPNLRIGDPCPYGRCDGSGFLVDEDTNTASDCLCRGARIAAARAKHLEGRIPKRYRGVSFDRPPILGMPEPVVSKVRRYVRDLNQNISEGKGLWFVGDVGTGKTTLAMLVSKAALEAGHSTVIYSLPRLLNLIRDEIGTDRALLDLLDSLSSVDLLHIDDLDTLHTTPWRLEQLYSLVDARYQSKRAIIVTTELTPDALSEQLGRRSTGASEETREPGTSHRDTSYEPNEQVVKRIVSRLVEMCGDPVPLFGEDRRRELPTLARPA